MPAASPQAAYPFSIYTLLALIWLGGAIILLLLTWQVNRQFARQIARSPEITDPVLLSLFLEAKVELRIHRNIRLIENSQVQSPAIMGIFQPTLLLPADVRGKFDTRELRFIFLHELAHLKRGDILVQALIALLQILHWFNPVLWFAFRRMRIDREPATDALVLSSTGEAEKERYGLMLIKLLEHFNQRHSLPTLVGILEDKDQFKHRFSLIAKFTRGAYGWSLLGIVLMSILSVGCLTKSKSDKANSESSKNTVVARSRQFIPETPTVDVALLQKNLLTAKEDADARRVLVNRTKDLHDEQFLNVLSGLGRADPAMTALQSEIEHKREDLERLLSSGYSQDHPRTVAAQTELDSLLQQRKEKIAGIRQALAIDLQMADSRVALLEKEVFNARHLAAARMKDLSDDQFINYIPTNTISGSSLLNLQTETDHKKEEFNELSQRYTPSHPKFIAAQSELDSLLKQRKDMIASLRQAMVIDVQTSDSQDAVREKEKEDKSGATNPAEPSPRQPDNGNSPIRATLTNSKSQQQIQIEFKVGEITDDSYLANKEKIDTAVGKGDIEFFNNTPGCNILFTPSISTQPGLKANVEIVRKFPYPVSFDNPKFIQEDVGSTGQKITITAPPTPRDFATKNIGVSAEITPTIDTGDSPNHGKIVLNGKFGVTNFDGFTKSNLASGGMASFSTSESLFLEALADNETKAIWIPSLHLGELASVSNSSNPAKPTSTEYLLKKRYLIFLTARLLK